MTNIQKANISGLTPLSKAAGSETSNDIIKDCNLCQVAQVDIQQHAFSLEHIRKVKEVFAQTTAAAATILNSGTDESDKETYRVHKGDRQQIEQQKHQLALMMMAFRTQNLSNAVVFNDLDENPVKDQNPAERNDNNFSSKPNIKYQKKIKKNCLKKKKIGVRSIDSITPNTTEAIVAILATENDFISYLNGNLVKDTKCNSIRKTNQNSNEQNDGNNNRNEQVELHNNNDNEFVTLRCKSSNEINEDSDISKSQIYNYNQTSGKC